VPYPVFTDDLGQDIVSTLLAFDGILIADERISDLLVNRLAGQQSTKVVHLSGHYQDLWLMLRRFFGQ